MLKICQILNWATEELKKAKIESATIDAELLLLDVLNKNNKPLSIPARTTGVVQSGRSPLRKGRGIAAPSPFEGEGGVRYIILDKTFLYAHPEKTINKRRLTKYKKFIARRSKNEPVAYILGHKEFFGLDFIVNKNTLIPRPETEMMVEEAIKLVSKCPVSKCQETVLIDVGTGSGCIPVSVLNKSQVTSYKLRVTTLATDISAKALAVAKKNAKLHGLDKKIKFIKSDLLNFLCHPEPRLGIQKSFFLDSRLRGNDMMVIITANLPYLSKKIYRQNYQGLKFEPRQALVAKNNGLDLYEKLLKQISILLVTHYPLHITILFELLPFQKPALAKLIKKHLPEASVKFKKDLTGKWRVAIIRN